jgi:hypothetical protein
MYGTGTSFLKLLGRHLARRNTAISGSLKVDGKVKKYSVLNNSMVWFSGDT